MEYLYLKWIDYKTNKKYLIGALFRDKEKNKYYFNVQKYILPHFVNQFTIKQTKALFIR